MAFCSFRWDEIRNQFYNIQEHEHVFGITFIKMENIHSKLKRFFASFSKRFSILVYSFSRFFRGIFLFWQFFHKFRQILVCWLRRRSLGSTDLVYFSFGFYSKHFFFHFCALYTTSKYNGNDYKTDVFNLIQQQTLDRMDFKMGKCCVICNH